MTISSDYREPAARALSVSAAFLLLVLVGLNLRPFLTALGPVLPTVRGETGLGNGAAAVLTTLPFLLMGVLALAGPRLAGRFGESRALLGALLLLALGAGLRSWIDGGGGLFLTAILAGTGIATVQALMPGVAKRWCGERIALAMGLYSAALVGGGALGALASPALVAATGDWRPGLAVWALPALLAWGLWLRQSPKPDAGNVRAPAVRGFLRSPRAWLLALYFGLANSGYASLVAWLPSFYQGLELSARSTGNLMAWMALFQAAGALLMPLAVRGSRDRRMSLYLVLLLQAIGFAGFALAPMASPALWIALAGFGLGGCFSLCLTVCLDHLPDARAAGALAAFMQGFGFLVNALGPWLIGAWLDGGGTYGEAWWCHGLLALALLPVAGRFDPAGYGGAMKAP